MTNIAPYLYLLAGVLFILALKGLSHPDTSRRGNLLGIIGMVVAIGTTLLLLPMQTILWFLPLFLLGGAIGGVVARRISMTALPQLVAAFHSLVGLSAVFVAAAAFYRPDNLGVELIDGNIPVGNLVEMSLGGIIGAITFSGSVIAFGKLQGIISGNPVRFFGQQLLNLLLAVGLVAGLVMFCQTASPMYFWGLMAVAFLLGFLLIIPIGGADMPVVVSMLNSYSGWAASGIGFTLGNVALIITGALVGSSGAILSYIMCKGMNRSIFNVIFGGLQDSGPATKKSTGPQKPVKQGSGDDAAFLMRNAASVIIVPGYGMAVSQAQHALKEMADMLKKRGITVRYAIHPVAGRMPGHMNVLLAEASVPYDDVFELDHINRDFATTDVAFVIGANDVTNPSAKTDSSSPIYGMPILEVEKSGTVLFIKRSMASGYAGVENPLFFKDNTMMLFGDAKAVVEKIIKALESN
ncbi:MAG: NAD(P)(+) transhydrogenase (Re/Si-specific) subunit beta [Hydrotalea sp.]|nr:NAD(P)(+) transhydrogenase (Re/Si-specific) subunit beta [Hydrotalea sp.]